jgi:iron complex outermembrane receptor protein
MKRLYVTIVLTNLFFLFINADLNAQNGSVQGKIRDQQNEPLPLVTVYITKPGISGTDKEIDENSMKGTVTDFDGFYRMEAAPGDYIIHFSAVGYKSKEKNITLIKDKIEMLDVVLEENVLELNEFIYSENKNATKLEETTVSIALVKPSLIQNRNATSGDLAIEQVPGIAVVDAEPQIRGASGFTAGLGSKVLIMIDDVPMLRGDAGRPVWSFIPLENMDQIEVIKGTGSVLYGSGASNGVINIRTAFPKNKPETMVSTFAGFYSAPEDAYKKPFTGFNPIKAGANFYHSRIIKTKPMDIDFVIGGQALWDDGYKGGEPLDGGAVGMFDTTRKNTGEYEHSVRVNFNTRFRLKKIKGLAFGVNANVIVFEESQSFFWQDADTNIYKMAPGTLTNFKNIFYYVDPYITYFNKKGDRFSLKTRAFQSYSEADMPTQSSKSTTFYGEFQYTKSFNEVKAMKWLTKDLSFIAGAMGTYTHSSGPVFNAAPTPDSSSFSANFAIYAQLEKKFFSRLTLTIGGRWEYFRINENEANKPVFRTGANFRVTDGTFIRASWGQGFRFPTIGERYINTFSGGYGFFSNPNLKPEESWTAEIGIKQLFKFGSAVLGFLDVAGFWQEYKNFAEFSVVNNPGIGFKFFNTGDTRIRGVDATFFIQTKIAKKVTIDFTAGYTYSLPQALQPDYIYDSAPSNKFTYNKTSSDTTNRILKYRIQHLVKGDLNVEWKNLLVGFTTRYYGPMQNIDNFFLIMDDAGLAFNGIRNFMENQSNGSVVFDARVSYKINKFKVAVIMENILNAEYSVRPLGIAPTRLSTVQLSYRI